MSTAVSKAGWILVDGSRIRQSDFVAFVGQMSGSCTAANIYSVNPEFFYELIFLGHFNDWFQILMYDHLLILTHITLTLHSLCARHVNVHFLCMYSQSEYDKLLEC